MSQIYSADMEIDSPRTPRIISIQTDFDNEARELYEWAEFL